ncbi:YigZ family protein [Deltaproteobacteria bacterium Smac51]|nr:YigZ family protein [Deltaproteobacteria bacterium Smac51]
MEKDHQYLMPAGFGEAELIEKKSKFVGRVWPVETEAGAVGHIEEMRRQHREANHNVYAYIVRGEGIVRCGDDGEPQGTSGLPTLGVFQKEGVTNVCCVVTRYFGGILLGAGGLVRAYSKAARLALDAAGINIMRRWSMLLVDCPYALYERMKIQVETFNGLVASTEFGADILLEVMLPEEETPAFSEAVRELSAGAVEPVVMDTVFRGARVGGGAAGCSGEDLAR